MGTNSLSKDSLSRLNVQSGRIFFIMITVSELSVFLPCQITHFRSLVREMAAQEWILLNAVRPKDIYSLTRQNV